MKPENILSETNASSINWNIRDDLKGKEMEEILQSQPKFPFSVCTINLDGSLNIGVMMRTAVIFGAEKFFVAARNKYDKRSTVGAHNYIEIVKDISIENLIVTITSHGYSPVCCELGGTNIRNFEFPKKPCFIFGNEGLGVPEEVLNNCQYKVEIPQPGVLRSLNVSIAAGIVMYEYFNKIGI